MLFLLKEAFHDVITFSDDINVAMLILHKKNVAILRVATHYFIRSVGNS